MDSALPAGCAVPRVADALLADPSDAAFERYEREYLALLEARFDKDRAPFDELAAVARKSDVYLGCNCPTRKQPDVNRCHTVLALKFMKRRYPSLKVELPPARSRNE